MAVDLSTLSAVIAEDQPLLRDGIASLLELNGAKVVGRCANADDLLLKVRSYAPDVAVIDIRMPPTHTFVDAVARVASGGTAFDPQVISALVAGKGHTATERLTDRELEVLSLMAEGLSNAAIGRRLYLSPRAVERDISSIFSKLELPVTDAHNRRVLAVLSFIGMRPGTA